MLHLPHFFFGHVGKRSSKIWGENHVQIALLLLLLLYFFTRLAKLTQQRQQGYLVELVALIKFRLKFGPNFLVIQQIFVKVYYIKYDLCDLATLIPGRLHLMFVQIGP